MAATHFHGAIRPHQDRNRGPELHRVCQIGATMEATKACRQERQKHQLHHLGGIANTKEEGIPNGIFSDMDKQLADKDRN